MASRNKKPHLIVEAIEEGSDSSSSSSSGSSDDSDAEGEDVNFTEELQVEFEARTPEEIDFHGICALLKKAFPPSCGVDISALTDLIIRQRSVGSVVTQSYNDDDSDDEDEPNNEIFGVATVVKLTKDQALSEQILQYLVSGTSRAEHSEEFRKLVKDSNNQIGLILLERIINMPAQIAVPLYETLQNEIRKARAKNLPFNFTHFFLISKLLSAPNDERNVMYSNAEEEVIPPECDLVLKLTQEAEPRTFSTLSQNEMVDQRRLFIFKAEKLEKIVSLIKDSFPIS